MNIKELNQKHADIYLQSDKLFDSQSEEHTKLSIEFTIDVLNELIKEFDISSDSQWWYEMKLENKIEELKTYLNDKN